MSFHVYSGITELSKAAAHELSEISRESIADRGRFLLALSGGNTPRTLYKVLARDYREIIDWQHVYLFWGDERYVPADDPESNFRLAKESLLDHITIPAENIYPIPTSYPDPWEAARAYSEDLATVFGEAAPSFDLILLGLGGDGHTASLFPGMTFDREDSRIVTVTESPVPPRVRISLTMNVLNAARNIFFLISGKEKAEILQAVLESQDEKEPNYPAARVRPKETLTWFVDKNAAPNNMNAMV
jgi:6-phosphogluconolactonase